MNRASGFTGRVTSETSVIAGRRCRDLLAVLHRAADRWASARDQATAAERSRRPIPKVQFGSRSGSSTTRCRGPTPPKGVARARRHPCSATPATPGRTRLQMMNPRWPPGGSPPQPPGWPTVSCDRSLVALALFAPPAALPHGLHCQRHGILEPWQHLAVGVQGECDRGGNQLLSQSCTSGRASALAARTDLIRSTGHPVSSERDSALTPATLDA